MDRQIILASSSPRRRDFLEKYQMNFDIISSNLDEKINHKESPEQVVMALAFEKAMDVAQRCSQESIVVAADTVVFLEKILGKPQNREEAKAMLMHLSGKEHSVFTGMAVVSLGENKKIIEFQETKVWFNDLSEEDIELYLNTGEYKDKAGAYGIQGFGEILVNKIEGDYPTIVGLPVAKLNQLFKNHFGINMLRNIG